MITVKTCKNCHGKTIVNTTKTAIVIECSHCKRITAKPNTVKIIPIQTK